jgi:S1-C subfamily serine protease
MKSAPVLMLAIAAVLAAAGSTLHAQPAPPPLLIPGKQFGFAFEPVMGDGSGVRVLLVVPGSPAERVGLKIGMVVTRLNDVPLGGLDMMRLKALFLAAPDESTMVVAGMGPITLRREAVPVQ